MSFNHTHSDVQYDHEERLMEPLKKTSSKRIWNMDMSRIWRIIQHSGTFVLWAGWYEHIYDMSAIAKFKIIIALAIYQDLFVQIA